MVWIRLLHGALVAWGSDLCSENNRSPNVKAFKFGIVANSYWFKPGGLVHPLPVVVTTGKKVAETKL